MGSQQFECCYLTLARLTYTTSQLVSHAALANLQALLLLSARHMAAQNANYDEVSARYWQSFAVRIIEKAKENLQYSLRRETRGANAAKYKDRRMATLAMLTYAIGKTNHFTKGNGIVSYYTWTGIVEESTFVLRKYDTTRSKVTVESMRQSVKDLQMDQARGTRSHAQHQTGPYPRLDDFPRLETPTSDSDIEAVAEKDNETGQHANVIESLEVDKEGHDIRFTELLERRKQRLGNMLVKTKNGDRP
ncbi:uncharacterized protein Z519_04971 [Cladophialophora bantiana CBS 173.52]|uniref:Uncharacterized protein n=1 Tax=Cladophialophora bantiana (strain ATCC 10958 / CBS 173.52 / CDC B-1940 / NIH 8579) TaxID=1442370 RepID=A0A0D2EYF7_CLAB1|nr:uncharacterized protein Z519_04971 [Cladophialophora bantiana CBS 173.52]KIW94991.1 hypothetical protein Z519_04971 [Cladophialophora bantiana CBS 173.52]